MNKVYQVISEATCELVYVTRSESNAVKYSSPTTYIMETYIDTYPVQEFIWDDVEAFKREYL